MAFVVADTEGTSPAPYPGDSGVSQPLAPSSPTGGAGTSSPVGGLGSPLPTSAATGGRSFTLDLSGVIPVTVAAQLIVGTTADPAAPVNNQVWLRTDTSQLSVSVNGVTKRTTLT